MPVMTRSGRAIVGQEIQITKRSPRASIIALRPHSNVYRCNGPTEKHASPLTFHQVVPSPQSDPDNPFNMRIPALATAMMFLHTTLSTAKPLPEGIPADEVSVILHELESSPGNSTPKRQLQSDGTYQLGFYVCSEANWAGDPSNCAHPTWDVPMTNAAQQCFDISGTVLAFGPDQCTQCDTFAYVIKVFFQTMR